MTLQKNDYKSYKTIFAANAILSFADGLYYPFLIYFFLDIGGMPLMGAGLGIIIIFGSIGSYFVGRLTDIHGRKPYLLVSAVVSLVVYISYPLLPSLGKISYELMFSVLIVILIINGITDGFWSTVEAIYLGDITVKAFRGRRMGTYWGASGIVFGIAMMGAGFIGIHIEFFTVAIVVAFIYLIGISMLFRLEESYKT